MISLEAKSWKASTGVIRQETGVAASGCLRCLALTTALPQLHQDQNPLDGVRVDDVTRVFPVGLDHLKPCQRLPALMEKDGEDVDENNTPRHTLA